MFIYFVCLLGCCFFRDAFDHANGFSAGFTRLSKLNFNEVLSAARNPYVNTIILTASNIVLGVIFFFCFCRYCLLLLLCFGRPWQ